jgi:D-sedoheptulose 7-phosphate isomerase
MTEIKQADYQKLLYPFLHETGAVNSEQVLKAVQKSTLSKCQEVTNLREKTLDQCGEKLIDAGIAIAKSFSAGATLYAFGNGGSSTDAQNIVVDCISPPNSRWSSFPAVSLTSDIAVVTAVGNDVGFENIFVRPLIALGRKGDVALGLSTSGNSPNILAAMEQAKKQQMLTVAIAGYDGGELACSKAVDYCLIVPCDYVPRIQEAQATLYHSLLEIIQEVLQIQKKSAKGKQQSSNSIEPQ